MSIHKSTPIPALYLISSRGEKSRNPKMILYVRTLVRAEIMRCLSQLIEQLPKPHNKLKHEGKASNTYMQNLIVQRTIITKYK